MGTHNIRLYKEVDKNYTGCNLKTTELLDCALRGACVVIRSYVVVLDKVNIKMIIEDNFCYFCIKTYLVGGQKLHWF